MILLKIVTNSLIQSTRFQIRAEILFACFKETDRRLLLTVSFLCNCGETPSQLSMNGINIQIDENFFTAVILNMEVRQHEKEIENNKGITKKIPSKVWKYCQKCLFWWCMLFNQWELFLNYKTFIQKPREKLQQKQEKPGTGQRGFSREKRNFFKWGIVEKLWP